jgi:CrcB protein
VVKEFTLNRCPSLKAGQMMTPDRVSCCGVISQRDPLTKLNAQVLPVSILRPGNAQRPCPILAIRRGGFCRNGGIPQGEIAVQKYLLIAIGGGLGSIARYWVGSTVGSRMGFRFPYGTLIVNLTACLVIGFTLTYMGKRADLNPAWRFLIPIGFVGAYSTFSTYEWETLSTMRSGAFVLAALYAGGSLILGLLAVWAGTIAAEAL